MEDHTRRVTRRAARDEPSRPADPRARNNRHVDAASTLLCTQPFGDHRPDCRPPGGTRYQRVAPKSREQEPRQEPIGAWPGYESSARSDHANEGNTQNAHREGVEGGGLTCASTRRGIERSSAMRILPSVWSDRWLSGKVFLLTLHIHLQSATQPPVELDAKGACTNLKGNLPLRATSGTSASPQGTYAAGVMALS